MEEKKKLSSMIERYKNFLRNNKSIHFGSEEWVIQSQLNYETFVANTMKNHFIVLTENACGMDTKDSAGKEGR